MDTAGDGSGRLFFPEKDGRLRMLDSGVFSTFLDLSSEVITTSERGLLGIAFHPGFANSASPGYRRLYTFHSVPVPAVPVPVDFTSNTGSISHHNVLTEWQVSAVNSGQVDITTRREIFREAHVSTIHNAGTIVFGPDGYLYGSIGTAPSGAAQNLTAQNNADILGTIYRIDPVDPSLTPGSADPISPNGKYRNPATNPFASDPAALDEIFAFGLRNPYRFSVDPNTGLVFAGDVGQGAREEVDVVPLGGNMGWPYAEGTIGGTVTPPVPPPTMLPPIAEYTHADGRAIVGGHIYRGSIPELQGKYIFGEFSWGTDAFFSSSGRLLWLDPFDEMGNVKDPSQITIEELSRGESCSETLSTTGLCTLDITLLGFGVDDDQELYAVGSRSGRGIVYKFASAFFLPHGDYNENGTVDDADYTVWQSAVGDTSRIGYGADGNADGKIDAADYVVWRAHYGETAGPGSGGVSEGAPEPSTLILAVVGLVAALWSRCRSRYPR